MTPTESSQHTHKYSIRKDGKVMMAWDDPALTYPKEILQSMKKAGYRFYIDGKLQR